MNDTASPDVSEVLPPEGPSRGRKVAAVVIAALSAIYFFVPEPTDVVPILGWIDEGVALALFTWSLRTLGVKLPFGLGAQNLRRPALERDVTPAR